jgi:hypothetical protein
MKSIVVWLWNDAQMIAPKDVRVAGVEAPEIRPDMFPRPPRHATRAERAKLRQVYLDFLKARNRLPMMVSRAARSFKAEHVNTLQRAFARCLPEPHRFICIADSSEGLSPDVEFIETPPGARRVAELRTPEGPRFPSCYRRLWTFSKEATILGERVMVLDIDAIPVADVRPLFAKTDDFVGWRPFRDWGRRLRFGGGIYLLTPGTRTEVWDDFTGPESIMQARLAGFRGSDQAWLSYKLAEKEPYWGRDAGIYSVRDLGTTSMKLPSDARIVQFNGHKKPWDYVGECAWVAQHWR